MTPSQPWQAEDRRPGYVPEPLAPYRCRDVLNTAGRRKQDALSPPEGPAIWLVVGGRRYYAPAIVDLIVGQPDEGPLSRLTGRELEVLEVLARGLDNREIAQMLHISENTAKSHVSSILDKLQVKNRTQASHYALFRGMTGGQ